MIIFIEDDDAYLHWIDQNPDGFVVNAQRRPSPEYLVLHRSTCPHISTEKRENWTTNQYIKVCSNNVDQLHAWAGRDIGGELKLGCHCGRTQQVHAPHELVLQASPQKVLPWSRQMFRAAIGRYGDHAPNLHG